MLFCSSQVGKRMSEKNDSPISFNVLLRGETDDVSIAASNLDRIRPTEEAIERCFHWLSEQGVICHRTDFGLACESTLELFESLFCVQVSKQETDTAAPVSYQLQGEAHPPSEIETLVSQVTLTHPPTFFN